MQANFIYKKTNKNFEVSNVSLSLSLKCLSVVVLSFILFVRRADAQTVTTFVSSGLNETGGMKIDGAGNFYVANYGNNTISKISPTGTVSVYANTGMNGAYGISFGYGGNLFVCNYLGGTVSKVTNTGTVTTFATGFTKPQDLAYDSINQVLYVCDATTIQKIDQSGNKTLITTSNLSEPDGLAVDANGNLYVDNYTNNTIIKITRAGVISTFATGGDLTGPAFITFDPSGNLYVANQNNNTISVITPAGIVSTFLQSTIKTPQGMAFDKAGNLYLALWGSNSIIEINPGTLATIPSISGQPSNTAKSYCVGTAATPLTVAATCGTAQALYQWYSNTTSNNTGGTAISGATSASYTPSTASAGTTYYYVVVSNANNSKATSAVSGAITINALPTVTTQPSTAAQTVLANATTNALTIAVSGGVSYQWYSNTSNANTGGTSISAATSTSYTPSSATIGTHYYYAVATNSNGCTINTNTSGLITINALTPVVSITAGSYTYNGSAQGPNSATNTGTGTSYTYSYAGTGSTAYSASATAPTAAGTYTVTATVAANGNYASASSSATAFTIATAPLTITASAQSKTYSATLSLGTTAFTATGLKSADAISSVTLTSTGTVNTAAVGVYSIVPSAAVFSAGSSSNYAITYSNGTLTVNAGVAGTWVGLTSSDFNTISNWQNYSVPTAATNVTIPTGTPYAPVLSVSAAINNLSIATGDSLSLNGKTLTINGAVSGNGTIKSTATSSLVINSAAGTINFTSGSNTIQNLTLNNGATATLGTQLNIVAGSNAGTVTIASGATLTTGGNLVLKSDINGTARIAQSAGSISGNVTVERYISAKTARKYSYIGSPVTANIRNSWQQQIYITGAGRGGSPCGATTGNGAASTDKYNTNGFDATSINATSMFTYSATLVNGSRYVSIPNTTSTNLTPGIGYIVNVRGNRNSATVTCADQLASNYPTAPEAVTLSATGTVTTGDLTVALNNPSVYAFTLLANPYPSQISFTAFQASNSNINGTMWTYNPTGNGNYTTYSNGIIVNGATSFDNTSGNYIASGQAFFVQANAAGTVTFHESHKTSGALPNTKYFGTTVNKMVRVALKDDKDSSVLDEIVVRYNSNGSEVYTQGWDASSLSSGSQALASVKGTKRLAIATHSDAATADTTKLYVKSTSVGAFKLSFSDFKDIDNAKSIILVDKFLGTKQDIRANQVYDFKVTSDTTSVGYNRFEVIVGGTNTSALPVSFTAISATEAGNAVNVKWNTAKETNIASYEVERSSNGVAFTTINSTKAEAATSYAIEDASIPATATTLYYRIKAIGTDGTTEYSAIAKLSTHNSSLSTISIYPNPVKTALNITLGSANGNYDVRIATIAGQQVFGKSGATLTNGKLTLDARNFASGVYVLELVDAKGNRQQEKFIKE